MNKLTSGRFLITIITGIVFLWATINNMVSSEQIVAIIMVVITFYFNKKGDV